MKAPDTEAIPTSRTLAVGAGAKLGAEAGGRLLQFGFIYAAQRALGPVDYGHLTFALALGFVLAPLTDLGLQLTLTRRLANRTGDPPAVIGAAFAVKSTLTLPALAAIVAVGMTRPWEVRSATITIALAVLVFSFTDLCGYAFRGLGQVGRDAALGITARAATVAAGLAALAADARLDGLSWAYVTGVTFGPAIGGYWLQKQMGVLRLVPAGVDPKKLALEALPLGIGIMISMLYARTAVFLLDALQGPEAVGFFGVAQRLTEPLAIIPAALMAAVFPVIARRSSDGSTSRIGIASVVLLLVAGTAIALAGFAEAPLVIGTLYGPEYEPSAAPLAILALAVAPTFVNYALTHVLIAKGLERRYVACVAAACLVNAVMCLMLVPRLGASGAAWAMLASEVVLLLLAALAAGSRRGRGGSGNDRGEDPLVRVPLE